MKPEGRNIPSRLLVAFELGEYHFEPGDVYTVVLTDITDSEDDYLGAEETTGTVAVGGSVTGNLEVDNDVDWFKVRLEEGKSYRIRMRGAESGGGTLADPTVVVGTIASVSAGYYGFDAPPPFNDDKSTTEKDSELVVPVFTTHDAYIHAATSGTGTGTYTIEVEEVTTSMGQRANSPATGGPGITGTVQAGETLTATTDGIEDEDGLTGAVFAYQWVRSDTDIEGAASSTYTVTGDDEGKPIQVRVTFTDDAGNAESLTSDAMAVAAALRLRSATLDGATLTLTYNDTLDSFVTLPQTAFTVSVNGGSRSVNAVSVAGASVTLTLASAAQAGDAVTVDYAKPNGPDFIRDTQGRVASSFSGRAVSNDTPATALTAAIHDAPGSHDGQEDFTFELRFSEEPKEGFSDVTLRDHAFTVTRGTVVGARRLDSDSATPNIRWEISVSPDSNADVTVELPATEDCEAQGAICTEDDTMLSSPLEFTVKGPPLTASVESAPPSHNGSGEFRFRIAFSEEPKTGFSYTTMRDHAFTVTGGSVKGARRLDPPSNVGWEVVVKPDSNGDVTVVLPVTTDCAAQGAICTGDGRPLSNRLEITVSGPSG